MIGMMMSSTNDLTMAPKAAPMITPTARSRTLPRAMKALNSCNMSHSPALCPHSPRTTGRVAELLPQESRYLRFPASCDLDLKHGFPRRRYLAYAGMAQFWAQGRFHAARLGH